MKFFKNCHAPIFHYHTRGLFSLAGVSNDCSNISLCETKCNYKDYHSDYKVIIEDLDLSPCKGPDTMKSSELIIWQFEAR